MQARKDFVIQKLSILSTSAIRLDFGINYLLKAKPPMMIAEH